MNQNLDTVVAAVLQMENDDLNRVLEAIKLRRNYLDSQRATNLKVGATVSFATRGMQVVGIVTKVNSKTVLVKQNNSPTVWRVHASIIKPVTVLQN